MYDLSESVALDDENAYKYEYGNTSNNRSGSENSYFTAHYADNSSKGILPPLPSLFGLGQRTEKITPKQLCRVFLTYVEKSS